MTNMHGYSGRSYDRWVERNSSSSTFGKVQKQFWFTKSAVMRKFGKKEDEHIIASDAELDAKIDLFRAIESSTKELQMLLADYQNRICILAQEENNLGRLLKEYGKKDNTHAGKMMLAVGKSLGYTAQQRVGLRNPLIRLFQEVDTFHTRAVEDTSYTVEEMEKVRTEYRGALMWMKNISKDFNPDHYEQLEKFREVQLIVKQKKGKFDQMKIKSLQKIDLLAASRCNMFSHALILYQNNLITFSEKTAKTLNTVASNFKGYHQYKFQVIKELAEPPGMFESEENEEKNETIELEGDDKTFFGADYHDDEKINKASRRDASINKLKNKEISSKDSDSLVNLFEGDQLDEHSKLLSYDQQMINSNKSSNFIKQFADIDLLSDDVPIDSNMSTQDLLKELFDSPVHKSEKQSLPVFGSMVSKTGDAPQIFNFDMFSTTNEHTKQNPTSQSQIFLPSQLIDFGFEDGQFCLENISSNIPTSPLNTTPSQIAPMSPGNTNIQNPLDSLTPLENLASLKPKENVKPSAGKQTSTKQDAKKLDWYKVFQDIDPLADPGSAIFGKLTEDKKC